MKKEEGECISKQSAISYLCTLIRQRICSISERNWSNCSHSSQQLIILNVDGRMSVHKFPNTHDKEFTICINS